MTKHTQSFNVEMDEELKQLLQKYKRYLTQVKETRDSIEKSQTEQHDIVEHLWETCTMTQTLEAHCVDDSKVEYVHSYSEAIYHTEESKRLENNIKRLHTDTNIVLYRYLYKVKLAQLEIQTRLDDEIQLLRSHDENPNLDMTLENKETTSLEKHKNHITKKMMRMLNTLFAAESSVSLFKEDSTILVISPFQEDVRSWILHTGALFLKASEFLERKFLVMHLLQVNQPASWAISLIQYPLNSELLSTEILEEYLHVISLIFGRSFDTSTNSDTISAEPSLSKWTEDDYIVVLDQLSITHAFCVVIQGTFIDIEIRQQAMEKLFMFIDRLLETLNTSILAMGHMGHRDVTKRLAQMTCQIVQILTENVDYSMTKTYQNAIDSAVSKVVFGYLDAKEIIVYNFFPILPFQKLSIEALQKITLQLLQLTEGSETLKTSLDLPDISLFLKFLQLNQMQGIFILSCLSNITTCILPDPLQSNSPSNLLIQLITHALFTTAFIDKGLGDVYYKDVRNHLNAICIYHPFVISLLLRWTYENFSSMKSMALYLFHSLPLDTWVVQTEDINVIRSLLFQEPSTNLHVKFTCYIIEHLNFGSCSKLEDTTISKSQPWHNRSLPFLPYEIHQEIALILLSACHKFQPLPETDKSVALIDTLVSILPGYKKITNSNPNANVPNEFVQWAWKIALQLKLYDCPISERVCSIEQAITSAFVRDCLHNHEASGMHHSLLIYIIFMLSTTSRHFLRFETADGWIKLLLILRRGKSEAVLQIMGEIIPAFVYMHGDDFYNDESLVDFLCPWFLG
ncbi:hypothetical protein BDF14DRAFT_1785472 [Spinellus fusiger]|nr:hypothetical protein BDF14DRAFT_1785472 [Spinellus fusiger]